MTPRLAWKSREAALAAADHELLTRLQSAWGDAFGVDPVVEFDDQELTLLALADLLEPARRAGGRSRAAGHVAAAVGTLGGELSDVKRNRERCAGMARKMRWSGDGERPLALRAELVRAMMAVPTPPARPLSAAGLALASIAAGFEPEAASAEQWNARKAGWRKAVARHSP